jgi:hypothetical protein
MLNYVGYVTGELSRIINTSNPLAWILAPGVFVVYCIPALINRTAEEQSPARSKQSTSRHSSTNLGAYRKGGLEQKILRLRKVDPNIYNDQEVQQAYLTLNKAKQLESLLKLQGE